MTTNIFKKAKQMTNGFSEWLYQELEKRGWQPIDLSRKSGVNSGNLSRILNGYRKAGPEYCLKIARALALPPELVFRKAGWLPDEPIKEDMTAKQLLEILKKLPAEDRKEILMYAIFRYDRHEKNTMEANAR